MTRLLLRVLTGLMLPVAVACAAPGSIGTPTAFPGSTPSGSPGATSHPPSTAAAPVVGPDGPWLVFAWFPDKLYLVRPDGTDRHSLALGDTLDSGSEGVPFAPSWSPDGQRIAFVMRTDVSGSLWTAAPDGSDARLLFDSPECTQSFWPVLSPDGKKLAMACYAERDGRTFSSVSVVDPATNERTDLVTFDYPETFDNPPSWSPDGSMLTFEVIKWDPTDKFVESSVVATVSTAGGSVHRLTEPQLFGGHPDWSPDGSLIAFNTYDTGNIHGITAPSNVYTIEPDGSHLTQLSTASVDGTMRLGQPFWSIDGARIWVSVAYDLERDSNDQFKNTLGWVDATTGVFTEIGTEGKRFRERPLP